MVLMENKVCDFGWKAADFSLPSIDGKTYALADVRGEKGTLIMFICNHCPYVKAVAARIARDAKELAEQGIGCAAIMPNDVEAYPEDSFDNMKLFARQHGFSFPYLMDESQDIARAYDARCTPEFFGFNGEDELQYHGRIDASRMEPAPKGAKRDLFEAMQQIAQTGKGPVKQISSMGCSIKWREA